ncbi:hypothetical protein D9M68_492200 [compost metagenome]
MRAAQDDSHHVCVLRRRRQLQGRQYPVGDRRQPAGGVGVRQAQQDQACQHAVHLRCARAGRADEPGGRIRRGAGPAIPVGMRATGRVRRARAGRRLLRPRAHPGGTGRPAHASARRAGVLPPPRQGPLPPRAARHPRRRAGRAGEKAAPGRAAAGMGGRDGRRAPARADRPGRRIPPNPPRQEFAAMEGAGRRLRQTGQKPRPPAAGTGRVAARARAAQAPLPGHELSARGGFPRPGTAPRRPRAAALGRRDLFGR